MTRRLLVFLSLVVLACCGGKKKTGIAELTKADGPVERQENNGAWAGAPIGTQFSLGDAARTADGAAELKLAGTQLVSMSPHTVLRFGAGKSNSANIKVELGAIDIINSGAVGLDVGDVKVAPGGKIRISAGKVELLIGTAQVAGSDGKLIDLVIGTPFSLEIGPAVIADAAIDAPVVPPDAAAPVAGDVEVEITGKGAEQLGSDGKTWAAMAEGKSTIPLGAKLRIKKAGTKARLVSGAMTLELSGASSQITVRENLLLGLELGSANATVPAATEGSVAVPGGQVDMKGSATAAAEAHVDVNTKGEAKVAMVHGTAKLVTASASLDIAGGESATVLKAGAINPGVVIPKYFDFQIRIGEAPKSFWVHDPKGSTALQFDFNGKCGGGGTIEADHDARFKTPRVSEGRESANMLLTSGSWAWRLRCGAVAATGQVIVVRDAGRRPLPPKPTKNSIDADGRNYTISYQSLIPIVEVHYKGTGSDFKLHVATGGVDDVIEGTKSSTIEIPGTKLKEGNYTFYFEHDGVKQDKISTLKITFDQTAAQVYIEAPVDGVPFPPDVDVLGAALPGWTAKVDAVEIPVIDTATRRFKAKVPAPAGGAQALAIRLSHPQRGIHFYLRRGTK